MYADRLVSAVLPRSHRGGPVGGHPGFLSGVAVINVEGGVLGGVAVGMAPRLASWLFGAAFIHEGAAPFALAAAALTIGLKSLRHRPGRWHRPRP